VLDTALRVWIVAAVVVGAAFIVLSDPVVTSVGVLLIILASSVSCRWWPTSWQ
jgi:uncharacterized membrane protein